MPSRRGLAKIVIEADDAVDFGARQVQRLCYQRYDLPGNKPELLLQRVQHWQCPPLAVLVRSDNFYGAPAVPGRPAAHLSVPSQLFPPLHWLNGTRDQ